MSAPRRGPTPLAKLIDQLGREPGQAWDPHLALRRLAELYDLPDEADTGYQPSDDTGDGAPGIGPLDLSADPTAATAAIDLALSSATRDGSKLWQYDGAELDVDTFTLIGALAKLAALLAGAIAADRQSRGEQVTAAQVLEVVRAEQGGRRG